MRELRRRGNKRGDNSQSRGGENKDKSHTQEDAQTSTSLKQLHTSETHESTHVVNPSSSSVPGTSKPPREKRGRGKTCLKALWNASPGDPKIVVQVNKHGQGIGAGALKLSQFMGTLVRKIDVLPLTYESWSKVPEAMKHRALVDIKQRFEYQHVMEKWLLMQLGMKWRGYKHSLKRSKFNPTKSKRELKRYPPPDVEKHEWDYLVDHWLSDKSQNIEAINKRNRARLTLPHTSGSKRFATIWAEETSKNDGVEPSRAEIFIMTHRRKDGTPINEVAGDIINKLQEAESQLSAGSQSGPTRHDVLSQVMGDDSHGRVRTMGPGVTPSRLWAPEHILQQRAENEQLKRKIVELEEQQRLATEQQKKNQLQEAESQLLAGSQSSPTRHDVLSQVIGEDSHGRVRTMDLAATPSRLSPPEHILQQRAENEQLKRKIGELEEQQRLATEHQKKVMAEQQEQQKLLVEQQQKMMAAQQEQHQKMNQLLGGFGALFANNEMAQTFLGIILGSQAPPPPPPPTTKSTQEDGG